MKLSYDSIGQWCATFACSGVAEGKIVKIGANATAAVCAAGDNFAGMAVSVSHGGDACSVQLGGVVTASYTGDTAPTAGFCTLAADGSGGVKVAATGGRSHLVISADTTAKTVTFVL
jgi:outer membrane scaffolding protein for murein synthesis (MipA/OmpV family)